MNNEEDLLMKLKVLSEKYDEIYKKTGGYFNIFTVLNVERNEVDTHSRFIYDFLNPEGSHCIGNNYLKLFVDNVLNLKFSDEDYRTVKVYREFSLNKGESRIDILIETKNFSIPIEVKIDAKDQPLQIERYYEYAKSTGKTAMVYYLTPNGREPSPKSLGVLYKNYDLKEKVSDISFETDIIKWLNFCIREDATIKISVLRETIQQYISLLKKITNQSEEGLKVEIVNLILSSEENFKSALVLEKNLAIAKAAKMKEIFKKIDTYVTKELKFSKFGDGEGKNIEDYYSNKRSCAYPSLNYKIEDIDPINNIGLYLRFEVNWNLYMGISIAELKDNKLEWLKPEKYMGMIQQYVNKEYIKCDENWILWSYIKDLKDSNYDFRRFTENIIELNGSGNYAELEFFTNQIDRNIKSFLIY